MSRPRGRVVLTDALGLARLQLHELHDLAVGVLRPEARGGAVSLGVIQTVQVIALAVCSDQGPGPGKRIETNGPRLGPLASSKAFDFGSLPEPPVGIEPTTCSLRVNRSAD